MPIIIRDGFKSSGGRLFTVRGDIERIDSAELKSMFLPSLNEKANTLLNEGVEGDFVRGQLQHYGVEYDESEFRGNGASLLQKKLETGQVRLLLTPSTSIMGRCSRQHF